MIRLTREVTGYSTASLCAWLIDASLRHRRNEFLSLVAIGSLGFAINGGIFAAVVRFLGLHYLIAKVIAAGFTFACNFITWPQFLFVRAG